MAFIMLGCVSSISTLVRVFYHEWILNFVKCFFCVFEMIMWLLSFVDVVYHIDSFSHVEPSL